MPIPLGLPTQSILCTLYAVSVTCAINNPKMTITRSVITRVLSHPMLSSEYRILIKTFGNLKDCLPEDSPRNTLTTIEKTNVGPLTAKLRTIERTAGSCRPRSSRTADTIAANKVYAKL